MVSLLIDGTDVFTGDTLFRGSVGGRARARPHDLRGSEVLDHGHAAGTAARRPASIPATPTRPPSPMSSRRTRSYGSGAGCDPEGDRHCVALGEPATLILLGDDYDGGHKAWVRWPDGSATTSFRDRGWTSTIRRPTGPPTAPPTSVRADRLTGERWRTATRSRSRGSGGRRRSAGWPPARRSARRARSPPTSCARRRAARPRSSAATWRRPSRSSPRWGR